MASVQCEFSGRHCSTSLWNSVKSFKLWTGKIWHVKLPRFFFFSFIFSLLYRGGFNLVLKFFSPVDYNYICFQFHNFLIIFIIAYDHHLCSPRASKESYSSPEYHFNQHQQVQINFSQWSLLCWMFILTHRFFLIQTVFVFWRNHWKILHHLKPNLPGHINDRLCYTI